MKFVPVMFLIIGFGLNVFSQEKTYKPVMYPQEYKAELDVIYTKVKGWEGRMDLYTNPIAEQPTPIVINIHGGGWNHGVKESQRGFKRFFKEGFAVANVEYRLVDVAPAPAAIEDVRCALIYIHKYAQELNIDTNKIVIMGSSAGGHLALMAGLLGNHKKFDENCSYKGEVKIAAIIDKYAPTDLSKIIKGSVKRWLGKKYKNIDFAKSVSPISYVDAISPPVIIIHGNEDTIIPYQQSVLLYNKLREYNVKSKFIMVKGGGHGKFTKEKKSELSQKIWSFLTDLGLTAD